MKYYYKLDRPPITVYIMGEDTKSNYFITSVNDETGKVVAEEAILITDEGRLAPAKIGSYVILSSPSGQISFHVSELKDVSEKTFMTAIGVIQ